MSIKNKHWIEAVADNFRPHFSNVQSLHYSHWDSGHNAFNFELEASKLIKKMENSKKFVVFAKSAGAILALQAIHDKKLTPQACIFVGSAVGWARETQKDVDLWLRGYSLPTLFIQKTSDPAISFEDLKKTLILSKAKNYKLLQLPGDNHDYEDIELLVNSSLEFVNELDLKT